MRLVFAVLLVACSKREAPALEVVKPIESQPAPIAPIVSSAPPVASAASSGPLTVTPLAMPMEISAAADGGRARAGSMSAERQAALQKELEQLDKQMLKALNGSGSSTESVLSRSDVDTKLLDSISASPDSGKASAGDLRMGTGGSGLAGIGDTRDR